MLREGMQGRRFGVAVFFRDDINCYSRRLDEHMLGIVVAPRIDSHVIQDFISRTGEKGNGLECQFEFPLKNVQETPKDLIRHQRFVTLHPYLTAADHI